MPDLPSDADLPIALVVKSIQCEMRDAVQRLTKNGQHRWILDWEAAYVITINVTQAQIGGVTAGVPYLTPDTLTAFGLTLGSTRTQKRVAKLTFTPLVKDVESYRCASQRLEGQHPFVSGKIGFSDWLYRAVNGVDPGHNQDEYTPKSGVPINIGHTFQFSIDFGGGIAPVISILPAGGASVTPSFNANRTDENILDVTFAAPKIGTFTKKERVPYTTEKNVSLSPADKTKLEELRKSKKILSSKIDNMPEFQIHGLNPLEPTQKPKDLTNDLTKIDKQISDIESRRRRLVTRTRVREVTEQQATPTNPSAQEALLQLQLERLLNGRRGF